MNLRKQTLVVSISAILLLIIAATAAAQEQELLQLQIVTKHKSLLECYSSTLVVMLFSNAFLPYEINATNSEVKQFMKNICEYAVGLNGGTGTMSEFLTKYYPNGTPESLKGVMEMLSEITRTQQNEGQQAQLQL
jgi:hypothetical protein